MRMKPAFEIRERSRVYVGPVGDLLTGALPEGRVVVVTDATVERFFAPLLAPYERLLVGQGEASKTLRTVGELYERLIDLGADRSTFILGVGGGIVTDVAGFVASTYMRGLRFGFVATTLLAQVDASVGGKNGVNVAGYKNMAGCFAQPDFVVCDPAMLCTLPDREFRAGLAEMVKAALIADGDLFAALERSSFAALREAPEQLRDLITAAIRVKADIVGRDERERGERRKLNLGHTLAHAIEKCSDRMNHGEAVAVGIALMAGAPGGSDCSMRRSATASWGCSNGWGSTCSPPFLWSGCSARRDTTRRASRGRSTSCFRPVSATAWCATSRRRSLRRSLRMPGSEGLPGLRSMDAPARGHCEIWKRGPAGTHAGRTSFYPKCCCGAPFTRPPLRLPTSLPPSLRPQPALRPRRHAGWQSARCCSPASPFSSAPPRGRHRCRVRTRLRAGTQS